MEDESSDILIEEPLVNKEKIIYLKKNRKNNKK